MEYNEKLKKLQQQVAEKKSLEAKRKELRTQQKQLQYQVKVLKQELQKEQLDVERMERTSLVSVLYSILGKKEAVLDREKAEAYAAKLKYDSAVQQLSRVEEDLSRKEAQLKSVADCERQYQQLLQEKLEAVKASGSPEAQQILRLEQEITQQESQKREIQEALAAGERALRAADDVLSSLKSAENWGTYDLVGGGLIADMVKHNHLDEAQQKVEQLQADLGRFKTELADVRIDADTQVNVEGFLRFADYFFDGLFVDWAVLDKINQSQKSVQNTVEQVNRVMFRLRNLSEVAEERLSRLQQEREKLVVSVNL